MDNEQILEEIRKYCDPYSILVIARGKLIRVRCPFRVRFLTDLVIWKEGEVVMVEKIMVTRDLEMVYIIWGTGYHYYLFRILLD
jgi:hypothetical protein